MLIAPHMCFPDPSVFTWGGTLRDEGIPEYEKGRGREKEQWMAQKCATCAAGARKHIRCERPTPGTRSGCQCFARRAVQCLAPCTVRRTNPQYSVLSTRASARDASPTTMYQRGATHATHPADARVGCRSRCGGVLFSTKEIVNSGRWSAVFACIRSGGARARAMTHQSVFDAPQTSRDPRPDAQR